jgi:NADH-quinone oxidoreductase subunit N
MHLDVAQLLALGWPLGILLLAALLSLATAVFPQKIRFPLTAMVAFLGFAISAFGFIVQWRQGNSIAIDLLVFDPFGNFLGVLVSLIGLVTTILSYPYLLSQEELIPEYFSLLLFAVSGMVLMVSTTQLLTFVLGLEVMSLSLYVLVGLRRLDELSGEAAFKYFLLGSVATAFLLFGISLFYGATGTLDLKALGSVAVHPDLQMIFKWGALLILLGFAFKVAAVPFHFWAPDAYDGAPYPVTGFMATGVKVAAFGALLRVVQALLPSDILPMPQFFIGLSLATMVVGNIAALGQRSLKRLMAYSSISHAGYLLLGVATVVRIGSFQETVLSPILYYLAAYGLLTLGVFAVLTLLSSRGTEINRLKDLDGLADQHPVLAATLGIFLISLAGIPPSAGFLAKYYLFSQAIKVGLYPLAIVGILASAISLYYYLGPVVRMYFRPGEKRLLLPSISPVYKILVTLLVIGVFYLGLLPQQPVAMTRATKIFSPAISNAGLCPQSP